MTPTKEVPTWPELVERMAADLYDVDKDFDDMTLWKDLSVRKRHDRMDEVSLALRAAGLTPEILEDARAVAWVEEENADASRIEHLGWAVSMDRGRSFCEEASTLREAVAKAKEADRG